MQDHGQTIELGAQPTAAPPQWLPQARSMLPGPGRYLALCETGGEIEVFAVEPGWMRIGRSANADIRLDDPSVSRRHALIVSEPPAPLRVLDDRSLNGLLLNGEAIDWGRLEDGDELTIGRYRLCVLYG
jgi:hypothetical protein